MANLTMGCYNSSISMQRPIYFTARGAVIRGKPVIFRIAYGRLKYPHKPRTRAYLLEINYKYEEQKHRKRLPPESRGGAISLEYAETVTKLAHEFCREQSWLINCELNHWPILQFIVSDRSEHASGA
jgi:hypothetical protein